jgi:hypothetical protein
MKTNSIRTRTEKAIAGAALAVALSTPNVTQAADQLAWDKTFPQSDKVIHQKVSFNNRLGINLVADLYIPKNLDRSKKHPAIVVGGPYGAVKEQSAGLYAQTTRASSRRSQLQPRNMRRKSGTEFFPSTSAACSYA